MNQDASSDKEFDPLSDFEPKEYQDPLEESLAETTVREIQHVPHASVRPDQSVREAVQKLASEQVSCLLVEDQGRLVGVFSDRDVLNKVALEPECLDQPVNTVMNTDPVRVYDQDPAAAALCVMAVAGFRHVPIVDLNEKLVGIVSPQRVIQFLSRSFT
jgi:predicted transcriptional regulator